MAKLLPALGGHFLQAPSEVAAVNMIFGCGAGGLPAMTFTSSPGLSLMLEGISYMIGAELPGVFVDIMRAGPGLGNIGPAQADVKLAARGLGHGDTHAVVLAPATPQEMLDFTMLAFELAFRYRNPVLVLADGHLGQMTGRVVLPRHAVRPGLPAWAVHGDAAHRRNLVTSIYLREADQEEHVRHLVRKFEPGMNRERAARRPLSLRRRGGAGGLLQHAGPHRPRARSRRCAPRGSGPACFRPQTVWPFPVRALLPLLERTRMLVVVEASGGTARGRDAARPEQGGGLRGESGASAAMAASSLAARDRRGGAGARPRKAVSA